MLLVLAMELANSAIAVIERYGSEIHELAGRARTWARQRCSC
jgi:diacylglycerol kinase (ATP)